MSNWRAIACKPSPGVAGVRPGSRGSLGLAQDRPFVSAKVAKTIDAPVRPQLERMDASLRRADQLARLKQGPPAEKSVPPMGQTADVGAGETNSSVTHRKER
jgi:hypothetical protein